VLGVEEGLTAGAKVILSYRLNENPPTQPDAAQPPWNSQNENHDDIFPDTTIGNRCVTVHWTLHRSPSVIICITQDCVCVRTVVCALRKATFRLGVTVQSLAFYSFNIAPLCSHLS